MRKKKKTGERRRVGGRGTSGRKSGERDGPFIVATLTTFIHLVDREWRNVRNGPLFFF